MAFWRQDPRFENVPVWFGKLLDTLLPDLQRPAPIDLLVGYGNSALRTDGSARRMVYFSEAGCSGGGGFFVSGEFEGAPEGLQMAELAFWLQDQVFPESQAAWGEARPACPGHTHPAYPDYENDEAWWMCPATQTPIGRMGELGRPTG